MKYNIYDNSTLEAKAIGTIDLDDSVGALELVALARGGNLNLVLQKSKEQEKAIAEEQEKNEKSLDKIQAEIDAEASEIPDKKYELTDLTGKQLKALCEKHGLETSGNKFDLIDRIEKSVLNGGETAAQKVSKSKK